MSSPTVRVDVHSGFETLPALEREWRELFARTSTEPSVSYEWTRALIATRLDPHDRCFTIVLRRGGQLAGVLPVYARGTLVFGQWHHILRPVCELKNTHSDILLSDLDPELLIALLGALRDLGCRWDSLRLSKLTEDHALTSALERAAAVLGFDARRRFRKAAYWISLPVSFEEYLQERSAKFRNHARRAEKKLRARGRLEVLEVTRPEDVAAGYAALLRVESASWKHRHGTAISADSRQLLFYRTWVEAMAADRQLHLQLLLLDGEPIAHNLGCIHGGTYYYLKTSYAADYRPQSPATYLRLRLIDSMITRGVQAVDFCGTPYEWEQQWTSEYRWHHVLSIYANTWRGRILARLDRWTHYSSSGEVVEHEDPRREHRSD